MPDAIAQSIILTQLPPESRESGASSATRGGALPDDVLASAAGRVRIAALISGAVWTLVLLANVVLAGPWARWQLAGTAGWPYPNWIYAAIGSAGSFGVAYGIWWLRAKPRLVLDLGLGLEVFTAALISLIAFYEVSPHAARISWVTAVILIYPAIAPAAPRKVLVAGLLAASMDAVGFGLAALRGQDIPWSGLELFWMLLWMLAPNYLCAILALVPTTLIRRLGREAGAARELGSYRLGRMLERGGMGEVYEATHRMIAKPAAIKLIRPELLADSPAFADMIVERFYREAEAVAALKSPHTVSLYDFGVAADGTLYYVMELLDGINLQRLVERFGPLPPERVVHILTQACDSLGEAHGRGMVHRDIKPSNILLCHLGLTVDFVKVLDFGLVRREVQTLGGADALSAPLGQPGTPAYMAPEAVHAQGPVDRRADLYALGCVGYWLLTGRTVFEGESPVQVMYGHGYTAPIPPSERLGAVLPVELEAVILATLAKSPDDRPQTAEDFAQRLASCDVGGRWDTLRSRSWWVEHLAVLRTPKAEPSLPA
jgi:tRNA A-37 threonylcarbamoyl transferase component Bud32